jgi:predicted nucleic acid-binding protein
VRHLLEKYEDDTRFYVPDVCFEEAQRYVLVVSKDRSLDADLGLSVLLQIGRLLERVDRSLYEEYEAAARERIGLRDPDDWPVVAVALLLDLPIWTEDQDFFGTGTATWTTDRVELYFQEH